MPKADKLKEMRSVENSTARGAVLLNIRAGAAGCLSGYPNITAPREQSGGKAGFT
jgi:hypothetical protein